MNQRLLSVLALLFLLHGLACSRPEQQPRHKEDLEPIESVFTYHTPDYHLLLRHILLQKAPGNCDLQFLRLPSFGPETLASVYQVEAKFEVSVARPESQIWESHATPDAIKCSVLKKSLPAPTAARLKGLWQAMLLRTRYQTTEVKLLDGVSYMFFSYARGIGDLSGEAKNPEAGTRAFALAEIGQILVAYVDAEPAKEQEALAKLSKAMDALDEQLAAASRNEGKKPAEPPKVK